MERKNETFVEGHNSPMLGKFMEEEISQQPSILRSVAPLYRSQAHIALAGKEFEMILLAARGSSDNAALFARYLIEVFVGIPVSLAAPSVLTRFGTRIKYQNCLAIGISQSGAAPDVAEVLTALREEGHTTLAITNTNDSRLTKAAEFSLLLGAGPEKSVAATKTYTASLLALYAVTQALGGNLTDPELPDDAWVQTAMNAAKESSGYFVRSQPIFSLARGFGFSTAHETALKLMECALLPCKAYSSADFEHGPKALAGFGSAAISFDGPMPDLAGQGCEIILAPEAPVRPEVRPIWDVIFGQWLALSCARARALDPDGPKFLRKVTETR